MPNGLTSDIIHKYKMASFSSRGISSALALKSVDSGLVIWHDLTVAVGPVYLKGTYVVRYEKGHAIIGCVIRKYDEWIIYRLTSDVTSIWSKKSDSLILWDSQCQV